MSHSFLSDLIDDLDHQDLATLLNHIALNRQGVRAEIKAWRDSRPKYFLYDAESNERLRLANKAEVAASTSWMTKCGSVVIAEKKVNIFYTTIDNRIKLVYALHHKG